MSVPSNDNSPQIRLINRITTDSSKTENNEFNIKVEGSPLKVEF